MTEGRNIFSQIGSFFKDNNRDRAMSSIADAIERINIRGRDIGIEEKHWADCLGI